MENQNLPAILSFVFGVIFLFTCCESSQKEEKFRAPNIILIMADDLGYEGIGCFGNDSIKTPNLDQLAQSGLKLTDFHSNGSVCTPTRAALLTGRYQQRAGLEGVIYVRGATRQTGLDTAETTIAEVLKQNGYATGIMGKWHLGYNASYNPVHHGFDEFYGYISGNIDFHSHYDNAGIYDWYHNLDSIKEEGYVTDLITEHALEFIEKNKAQPFFLYVPHEAPHVPFQGRNDPAYRFAHNEFSYYGPVKDRNRAYKEMVEVMDEGIGRVLDRLNQLHLEEQTLVIFISDNGAERFGHNGPLNGDKGSLLEGGHRVPGIISWKGKIEPGVSDATIMSFDLMPTILALSQSTKPEDLNLDGVDLSSLLLKGQALAERPLFWKYRKEKAVRQGPWKLYINEQDTALYHLQNDLREANNLASDSPIKVEALLKILQQWEVEVNKGVVMKTK